MKEHVVGVIADTHGLLRPEALDALAGVERILHAGDLDEPEVLDVLGEIAPVVAVRGNNDVGAWAKALRELEIVSLFGARIAMIHDRKQLSFDPAARGIQAVISGHSHRPAMSVEDGVLHLNPGSAGPRRFRLPIAVAKLYVARGHVRAEIVPLG